jgi:hypothetical protein
VAARSGATAHAWEKFESIVTLAVASLLEGAAFQPWELAFCIFSVSISSPPLPSSTWGFHSTASGRKKVEEKSSFSLLI